MAVIVKSVDMEQVADAVGYKGTYVGLKKHGMTFVVTPSMLKVAKDGEVIAKHSIKAETLKAIAKGNGLWADKKWLKDTLNALYVEHVKGQETPKAPPAQAAPSSAMDKLKALSQGHAAGEPKDEAPASPEPDMPPTATPQAGSWSVLTVDQAMKASLAHLRDSNKLYQPVHGSDKASCYAVVALSEQLKAAARVKNDQLSLRLEGPALGAPDTAEKLGSTVLVKKKGPEGYASMHLAIPNDDIGRKALGALLMGLGWSFDTPLPDFDIVKQISTKDGKA